MVRGKIFSNYPIALCQFLMPRKCGHSSLRLQVTTVSLKGAGYTLMLVQFWQQLFFDLTEVYAEKEHYCHRCIGWWFKLLKKW